MLKFAVFASGGGTDFQSLIDGVRGGQIPAQIACLIAGNRDAYAIKRAQAADIPVYVIQKKDFSSNAEFDEKILQTLAESGADFAVLAGYLNIIGSKTIKRYQNKILNIHPSLIPAFCGMGMYGRKVHQAVLDYGAKISGATVHFVTEEADAGPIILQRTVEVAEDDTPETLAERVLEVEHRLLPEAVALMAQGRLHVDGRCVRIKD